MKRLSLLSLWLSLPLLAEGTDFAVEISNGERQPTLQTFYVVRASWTGAEQVNDAVIEVDFPGEVTDVYQWDSDTRCTKGKPVRCTASGPAQHQGGFTARVLFSGAGTYSTTARITGRTTDPRPENNTATHTLVVTGQPSLRPSAVPQLDDDDVIDPAGLGKVRFGVQNDGEEATAVILRLQLPEGGTFLSVSEWSDVSCTVAPTEVTCRSPKLRNLGFVQLVASFLAPDVDDGRIVPFVLTADADQEDFAPADDTARGGILLRRVLAVTNPADEGSGTLRQALLEAQVFCGDVPCLLRVRGDAPLLVQPRTPLPHLRGRLKLDGFGRTTLDGSLLADSGGLFYEGGCELRVHRLTIRNFKGHAIEAHPEAGKACTLLTPVFVTDSDLGANLRGIVTKGISATIMGNTIHDHVRAGIFADGAYYNEIARNTIAGNGASGIFINARGSGGALPAGADIYENTIRGNGEWGIARTEGGSVSIHRNSISGNNLYGIDTNLDLDSRGMNLKPVLFSAVYRPDLDATIVRGHAEPPAEGGATGVDLYASASLSAWGYPEAETMVLQRPVNGDFELTVPGDLRGKWITATGSRTTDILFARPLDTTSNARFRYESSDTSELSNAVRVE